MLREQSVFCTSMRGYYGSVAPGGREAEVMSAKSSLVITKVIGDHERKERHREQLRKDQIEGREVFFEIDFF